jgi:hypothetical protein
MDVEAIGRCNVRHKGRKKPHKPNEYFIVEGTGVISAAGFPPVGFRGHGRQSETHYRTTGGRP